MSASSQGSGASRRSEDEIRPPATLVIFGASGDLTRRLLALWHVFHVPLGVALFTLAFIHIGAALYYATFSR